MSKVSFARSIRAAPIRPRPAGSTGGFDVEDHAIVGVDQMVGGTGKIGRPAPVDCEAGSDSKVALGPTGFAGIIKRFATRPDSPRRICGINAVGLPVQRRLRPS
jgi:hypothetical protein